MTSFLSMKGQISDDFDDSGQIINELWSGDRDKFEINTDNQLQLSDQVAGQAMLWQPTFFTDSMTWELWFSMDFNPSNSNQLFIILFSDKTDLLSATGYGLQIGENGNGDAISLVKIDQGSRMVVAEGSMSLVAEEPVVRLSIMLDNDFLTISSDPLGGICFETEIEAIIDIPPSGNDIFFGLQCLYTKSRSDKFFFDDIYVGQIKKDVLPPTVTNLITKINSIEVLFSEPIFVENLGIENVSLQPQEDGLVLNLDKSSITIVSNADFSNTIEYELALTGIKDLSGNHLDTTIAIQVAAAPQVDDLLIHEVLFNPVGSGSDFIEIINTSAGYIDLSNLVILNTQNDQEEMITDRIILPMGGIAAFTDDPQNIIENFNSSIPENIYTLAIPRLNNDDGNVTLSFNGSVIDAFDYDEDLHHALLDDVEGVSLERISINRPSNENSNWASASIASGFGTPGSVNSFIDATAFDNNISLKDKVFTPNQDGDKDELIIAYELDKPGYVGTVIIFSDHGNQVAYVVQNEILGSRGTFVWNGEDASGVRAPFGLYIALIELFHLDGSRLTKKLTFGLADFLN